MILNRNYICESMNKTEKRERVNHKGEPYRTRERCAVYGWPQGSSSPAVDGAIVISCCFFLPRRADWMTCQRRTDKRESSDMFPSTLSLSFLLYMFIFFLCLVSLSPCRWLVSCDACLIPMLLCCRLSASASSTSRECALRSTLTANQQRGLTPI